MKGTSTQQTAGWCRRDGRWLVCCAGGAPGRRVTVTRKDGSNPTDVVLNDKLDENQWGGVYRYTRCDRQNTPAGPAAKPAENNRWVRVGGDWMVKIRDGKKYDRGDTIRVAKRDGTMQSRMVVGVFGDTADVVCARNDGTYECSECGDYVLPGTTCWEMGGIH